MTTEFLKECMADALIKLLAVKPIEKITVQEIVTYAGVGRTTWFRSFASKREALATLDKGKQYKQQQNGLSTLPKTPPGCKKGGVFA